MSGFNNLTFTTTPNGELNISSQNITGVPIVPVAPSTIGLISLYALLDSPNLVGTPTAPTPNVSNNSIQIATTAHVHANRAQLQSIIDLKADKTYVDASLNLKADKTYVDASLNLKANITYVDASLNLKANILDPFFIGIPRAETALATVHTTQLATTEYVYNAINNLIADAPGALDTLKEIAEALALDDEDDARTLQLILNTISNTDASFGLVDASFGRVDASFSQVYTSKADKSSVATSFGVVDASFSRVATSFAHVDASFSQVYTSKADKNLVDASFERVYTSFSRVDSSFARVDASLNLKANDNDVVHINNNETINGKKQFRYTPSNSSDNGNEFILFGGDDYNFNFNPTLVGITGNFMESLLLTPNWNNCGMNINSNAVRFYDPFSYKNGAMIDNIQGKIWANGFYVGNNSIDSTTGVNTDVIHLNNDGLYANGNLGIYSLSNIELNSGVNTSIFSTGDTSIESNANTSITSTNTTIGSQDTTMIDGNMNILIGTLTSNSTSITSNNATTLSSKGTTMIDASQNILIGTNTYGSTSITSNQALTLSSKGTTSIDASQNIFIGAHTGGSIIMGNYYNDALNNNSFIDSTNKTAPAFLTIGKSKLSNVTGYNYFKGGSPISGSINTLELNKPFSIVAQDRIGCFEFNAFSDLRLKENVDEIDITEAMKLIKNIKPVTFDWKDSKQPTSGFIAQDILKNGGPTHLVSTIYQDDLEETVDSDNFVSPAGAKFVVNYNGFIPYYHKVIKNLVDRIEELEKKLI